MSTVVERISKKFGETTALSSIDLTIEKGEFVAILGPSGCGKTTLLRLLAGFEKPSAGSITMNDELIATHSQTVPPEKRNIGMVFQSFALWPHLKVKEQIQFPIQHHRYVPETLKKNSGERVREMLELVGLSKYGERMPSELSGGQKQRVAIARALAPQPALLLMDEPLSSLDAELRMDLRKEIQTIHRFTKTSIVYVTHDQGEALAMADKIVVMKDGQIEQIGSPEEIFLRPETMFVAKFVGKANILRGSWTQHFFKPEGETSVVWENKSVSTEMRNDGLFPVRPEQLVVRKSGCGLQGIVRNVMFQGKEIHYSIEVNGNLINVHTNSFHRYHVDEKVVVDFKLESDLPVYSEPLVGI
ncbi:ABC transporter ATP-binding protein [Alkalihalobacterium chitinilyticum]|uniref:ABC transporter ATP-binding protein n=1 Tax=Alkalihalobacterium chitinilyticum TaxID=2980103 RepID=A0ABT5VGY6_9BACI|nr:ABC transporter ATP-binding protein [Alkalihalobacterium chitinilyticum]MDE5413997.1 ABC transporter ATP-binding protein [Alkalihalobacterium chitinilyticum]